MDKDLFTKDDKSQRLLTTCSDAGSVVVHQFHIESDATKGRYTLLGEKITDVRSNHGSLSSFMPAFIYDNEPKNDRTSSKAIKLNNLINPFQINDNNGLDEIYLSILSDTLGQMFRCGPYDVKDGGLIDLKDLIVPCDNMIALTITESDTFQNDGHTVLVPCSTDKKEFDLFVPKSGLVREFMDSINNAAEYLGFM